MQHAAEISPLVHERSIGPDIELKDYKENESHKKGYQTGISEKTNSFKNDIDKKKTPSKTGNSNENFSREPNSLHVSVWHKTTKKMQSWLLFIIFI